MSIQREAPGVRWRFLADLLFELIKRDVLGRYRGSLFGVFWSLLSPVLMLSVYTFAFHELLGARWAGLEGKSGFATMAFAGMILHAMLSETLQRAPAVITGNPNFVTKVVFPLGVLPLIPVGAAVFHALLAFMVLAAFGLVAEMPLHWTICMLPAVIIPFILILTGLSWALAGLGVYIRDISQVGAFISTALLFLSPVFYPLSSMPQPYEDLARYNPLAFAIESSRGLAFSGEVPSWEALVSYWLVGACCAAAGWLVFSRLRNGFGDVL